MALINPWEYHVHVDGSRLLRIDFHCIADGSGEESYAPLIDLADYPISDGRAAKHYKIREIKYSTSTGTSFRLLHDDGAAGHPFFLSTTNDHQEQYWSEREASRRVPNATGRIMITTSGFDASGDTIWLSITLEKVFKTADLEHNLGGKVGSGIDFMPDSSKQANQIGNTGHQSDASSS